MANVTHKGIYYWEHHKDALRYAETHGYPTDRIIRFELGWAVQIRVSGPYLGPIAVTGRARP